MGLNTYCSCLSCLILPPKSLDNTANIPPEHPENNPNKQIKNEIYVLPLKTD